MQGERFEWGFFSFQQGRKRLLPSPVLEYKGWFLQSPACPYSFSPTSSGVCGKDSMSACKLPSCTLFVYTGFLHSCANSHAALSNFSKVQLLTPLYGSLVFLPCSAPSKPVHVFCLSLEVPVSTEISDQLVDSRKIRVLQSTQHFFSL